MSLVGARRCRVDGGEAGEAVVPSLAGEHMAGGREEHERRRERTSMSGGERELEHGHRREAGGRRTISPLVFSECRPSKPLHRRT